MEGGCMTGPALGSSEAASTHHQFHRVAVGRVVRLAVLCSCQQLDGKTNILEKNLGKDQNYAMSQAGADFK
jgi:hypothetical protein